MSILKKEKLEAMKAEFEKVKRLPNYLDLLKKYFELPTRLAKMNPSVQEKILRENFKFLERIVIPLGDECWPLLRNLFGLIETLKPDALIELSKIEISERLDSVSGALSKETVEKELILIIDRNFLAVSPHTTTKVKLNTLKVFSRVLQRLEPVQREKYADLYYSALQNHKLRWRFRMMIVSQFEILSKLFSLEKLNAFFLPMLVGFCRDECYAVRRSATASFWLLYKTLHEGDLEIAKMVVDINLLSFSDYQRFSFRQSFVYMVEGILINCPNFLHLEVPGKLIELSRDPVINVRLSLAKMLRTVRAEGRFDCSVEWFRTCFENLRAYEDKDVSDILVGLEEVTSRASVASQSQQSVSVTSEGSGKRGKVEPVRLGVVMKKEDKVEKAKEHVEEELKEEKEKKKEEDLEIENKMQILDNEKNEKKESVEKEKIEENKKVEKTEENENKMEPKKEESQNQKEELQKEKKEVKIEEEKEPFTVIKQEENESQKEEEKKEEIVTESNNQDQFEELTEKDAEISNSEGSDEFKPVGEDQKKTDETETGEETQDSPFENAESENSSESPAEKEKSSESEGEGVNLI